MILKKHQIWRWFMIVFPLLLWGQTSDSIDVNHAEYSVKIATKIEPNHVPMNREVIFTVQVSWQGDMDRIEIEEVEEPLISHLEIVGTASTNHVLGGTAGSKAVREIIYTLKPTTLGMAYIEFVGLRYEDKLTGESHLLRTERVGIEVLPPVKEHAPNRLPWWVIVILLTCIAAAILWIVLRRNTSRHTKDNEEDKSLPEETYLSELKTTVSLKEGDRRQAFSALSKLFRRYLAETYHIQAMEATTESLLLDLTQLQLDESTMRKFEALFKEADVIKFSGQEATQDALESAYTTVELFLESRLADAKKNLDQQSNVKKKRKI